MRKLIETSRVTFTVTLAAVAKSDGTPGGRQKTERDTGRPLWTTQVMALDSSGAEVLTVTTPGVRPEVTVGEMVVPVNLEAVPWVSTDKDGKIRHGVAFKADELRPVGASLVGANHSSDAQ
jgi:hypothetical protein